jgi:hypothetical protein
VKAWVTLAGTDAAHLRGALRAINKARNNLSHHLESSKFSESLETFVREIGNIHDRKTDWPSDLNEQLRLLREAFDEAAHTIFDIAINKPSKGGANQ